MKWAIEGADRDDGTDITLVVEAKSKADAVARANDRRILVSAVSAVPNEPLTPNEPDVPTQPKSQPESKRVPCPSCAEQVSTQATLCPFCKQPIFSTNQGANAMIAVGLSVVLFVALFFGFSALVRHEADKDFRRIINQSEKETSRIMRQAERDVEDMMRRHNR